MTKEWVVDGVRYAEVQHQGQLWLLGSTNPEWRQIIATLGIQPTESEMTALEQQGIWLAQRRTPEPFAVLCCGIGAGWVGMGRELYATFPLAREAMDRVQSVATWDVLHLLEIDDLERLNATRWQIPLLFLLEYAQWYYLSSLGCTPALFCGHSLGELIALCCAGIYDWDVAWHILDTRAEHVSLLEKESQKNFGMLAVHANLDVVQTVLDQYPEITVANYNTPAQFILSGDAVCLQTVKRELRKQRIPSVHLNVSLLFHHPQMRILRDLSILRLNTLSMHAPAIPVLSAAIVEPYPSEQEQICRFLTDLDENPVRWSTCVRTMVEKYGIESFLELGPQDVLQGLVKDNYAPAKVMACGRKNHEAQGMRTLCARLFSQGRLDTGKIQALACAAASPIEIAQPVELPEEGSVRPDASLFSERLWPEFLDLLSGIASIPVEKLSPGLDLRHDLGLRSSSFPLFLAHAEQIFQHRASFESLLRAVTVLDLYRVLLGEELQEQKILDAQLSGRLLPLKRFESISGTWQAQMWGTGMLLQAPFTVQLSLPGFQGWKQELLLDLLGTMAFCAERILVPELVLPLFAGIRGNFMASGSGQAASKESTVHVLVFAKANLEEIATSLSAVSAATVICIRLWEQKSAAIKSKNDPFYAWLKLRCPSDRLQLIELADSKRRYVELADCLTQAIFLGSSAHVLWVDEACTTPPACAAYIAKRNHQRQYCLAPVFANQVARFQGKGLFSEKIVGQMPYFPTVLAMHALMEASIPLAPWLKVVGFSDLVFGVRPEVFPHVTLEAQVHAKLGVSIEINKVLTRQSQGHVSFAGLTANGRKNGREHAFLFGTVLLAKEHIPHFQLKLPKHVGADVKETDGSPWRLFQNLERLGEHTWQAELVCSNSHAVALDYKSEYNNHLILVEGILQATYTCLSEGKVVVEGMQWHLSAIGFILFGDLQIDMPLFLTCKRTWNTENLQRFDAAVTDAKGEIVLQVAHLEWLFGDQNTVDALLPDV